MKLSIITINFNNKASLQRTIDSVISQTWSDFEWIIIDGGSTDGSKLLIEQIAEDSKSQIRYWCSEPDGGIYQSLNKGVKFAQGEFFSFMNSGDTYCNENVLNNVFFQRICGRCTIWQCCVL